MTPRILDVLQGSPEWHAARAGKVTASQIADMLAKTKSGWGASRANLAAKLVAERLTGTVADSFSNAAMQWGTEQEPVARQMYEFMYDVSVHQVGFVIHPTIEMSGASPDGLVGDDGLVEIKCPNTATHINSLLGSQIDGKYVSQMQWQMACTGRQWCDYVSYDPRMPGDMQIIITRVHRDPVLIAEYETATKAFLSEIDATVASLVSKYRTSEAAE